MKAVILAAGHTRTKKGFPPDSKPKTLFHVNGKTLLERILSALRGAGVSDIRIVVGYKRKQIERFIKKHQLKLEVVYNPKWDIDAINSLKVGLKGVKDDVLIVYGDVRINPCLVKKFLECKKPIVLVKITPRSNPQGYGYAGILKVNREMLHIFERPYKTGKSGELGIRLGQFILKEAIGLHKRARIQRMIGVLEWSLNVQDTDHYMQTDEGKRTHANR